MGFVFVLASWGVGEENTRRGTVRREVCGMASWGVKNVTRDKRDSKYKGGVQPICTSKNNSILLYKFYIYYLL